MLFIPCDNWKILFFLYRFIITQSFGETTILLRSLKQVFLMKPAIYIRYLYNNITMLQHTHKKRKDSLETRAVLLIFLLELKISWVVAQSIHQNNSEKWRLLLGIAQ